MNTMSERASGSDFQLLFLFDDFVTACVTDPFMPEAGHGHIRA